MIDREQLCQILQFVSRRWSDISKNPDSKVLATLPDDFWMNSVGGKAGSGRWVTTLMYTENQSDADAFKKMLLRWQAKGARDNRAPDLIQIERGSS